jgi:hypothetical protein
LSTKSPPKRQKKATPTGQPRIRIPLKSAAQVRVFQARCIRRLLGGGGGDWYKAAVISGMLLKTIEVEDVERRMAAIENKLGRPS